MHMALRTAIYMRVSTQDQSVESQRHELKRFVEARDDLELVGEYEDVISGVTEKRAQLDELMLAARQRRIDAVVFFDFTRLTRKGIQHALELLRQWREANVSPICYSFPMLDFSDDSGTGEVIAALLAWDGSAGAPDASAADQGGDGKGEDVWHQEWCTHRQTKNHCRAAVEYQIPAS
jgi:DNA invertase Pin-like site-specific DNA recombinase